MKQCQYVEIVFLKEDVPLFEVLTYELFLFFDWFRSSINFLQDHLHEVGLALGEHLHFLEGLAVDRAVWTFLWCFKPMDDSLCVLVSSLLEMSLYHLGIVWLETI